METSLNQPILPIEERRIGLFFGTASMFELIRALAERAMQRALLEECLNANEVKKLYLNGLDVKEKVH